MPLWFLEGIGSLGEVNLILLTGLNNALQPNNGRILEILKEMEELKGAFRLLNFFQGSINDKRIVIKEILSNH